MELDQLKDLLIKLMKMAESLSWYHYALIFFLFLLFFGKRKEWEYEAKLFEENSNDIQGEVKIKKFKKEHPKGKIVVNSIDPFLGKEIEIYMNDQLISKIQLDSKGYSYKVLFPLVKMKKPNSNMATRLKSDRKWNRIRFNLEASLIPENNDKVVVKVNRETVLQGSFLRD